MSELFHCFLLKELDSKVVVSQWRQRKHSQTIQKAVFISVTSCGPKSVLDSGSSSSRENDDTTRFLSHNPSADSKIKTELGTF